MGTKSLAVSLFPAHSFGAVVRFGARQGNANSFFPRRLFVCWIFFSLLASAGEQNTKAGPRRRIRKRSRVMRERESFSKEVSTRGRICERGPPFCLAGAEAGPQRMSRTMSHRKCGRAETHPPSSRAHYIFERSSRFER